MAMTLAQKVEKIVTGLQLEKGGSLLKTLHSACDLLGLEQSGSLQEKADRVQGLVTKIEKLKTELGMEAVVPLTEVLAQACETLEVPQEGPVQDLVHQCLEKLEGPQEPQPDPEKLKILIEQLGLDPQLPTKDLVAEACAMLEVEHSGTLIERTDKCMEMVKVEETKEPEEAPKHQPTHEFSPLPRDVPLVPVKSEDWTVLADPAPAAPMPPPLPLGREPSATQQIRHEASGPVSDDSRGFGIKLLLKLLENMEQALRMIQSCESRQLVVLLGETGVGKSTLIQFLAGKKLRRLEYQGVVVYDAEDPVPGFRIGHSHTSETASIRPFPRPNGAIYVDSAGYEDTQGVEIDIATSVSFQKLAAHCSSLRFVVVINAMTLRVGRGKDPKAVVDLVSQVVDKFDEHKKAFTFLFTRTDDLTEMRGQPLEIVLKALQTQLASVAASSKGKAKLIFDWMVQCLEKKWPFVEVFHPEKTQREELLSKLELFRDPGTMIGAQGVPAQQLIRCGLTPKMKSYISVHLDTALDEMQEALENEDVERLNQLYDMALFLHKTIGEDTVRQKVEKLPKLLVQEMATKTAQTEMLIQQGTEVGPEDFTLSHAVKAMANIDFLRKLPGQNASLDQFLEGRIQGLVDGLVTGEEVTVDGLQLLQLLALWAEAERSTHKTLGPVAQKKNEAIAQLETTMQVRMGLVRSYLQKRSFNDFVPLLPGLEALGQHAPAWLALGVQAAADVPPCLASACGCVQAELQLAHRTTLDLLRNLETSMETAVAFDGFNERCEAFEQSQALTEPLLAMIEQQQGPTKLLDIVMETRAVASRGIGQLVEVMAQDSRNVLESLLHRQMDGDAPGAAPEAGELLRCKVSAVCRLAACQRGHADSFNHHAALCQEIYTKLQGMSATLETLCSNLRETGLGSADQHVRWFTTLQASSWLDRHLAALQMEPFVKRKLEDFKAGYVQYQEEVLRLATEALQGFLRSPLEEPTHFDSFRRHLVQIQAMQGLSALFPASEAVSGPLRRELQNYVELMSCKNKALEVPEESTSSDMAKLAPLWSMAADIEEELHVHKALASLSHLSEGQALCSILKPMVDPLEKKLASCSKVIEAFFGSGSDRPCLEKENLLDAKAVLQALARCRQESLDLVLAGLPAQERLCREIDDQVRQRATELREQVQSAAGPAALDKVAVDLTWIQDVQVLDSFIMHSASMEHQTLSHLLQLRRCAVDDGFRDQIVRFDFDGLGQRLEELQASSLPESKKSFKVMLDAIAKSIEAKIAAADWSVSSAPAVAECMKDLKVAEQHVGKVLREHKSIDIPEVVQRISGRVQEHLLKLVSELDSAITAKNFRQIAELLGSAEEYSQGAASLLDGAGTRKLESSKKEAEKVFSLPLQSVEALFQRLEGKDEDCSGLTGILDNLKMGAFRVPSMSSLVSKYNAAVHRLCHKLKEDSRTMEAKGKYGRSEMEIERQMEYFQCLKTEYDRGLKEHLADLGFNPTDKLKTLEELHQIAKEQFQRKLQDRKYVDEVILGELDKLEKDGWPFGFTGVYTWHQHDCQRWYKNRCKGLQEQLLNMLSNARSNLDRHNYDLVTPLLKAFLHSWEKLKKHLKSQEGPTRAKHLQFEICRHFDGLQGELGATLARGNIDEFGKVFRRYLLWCNHLGDRDVCPLRLDPADLHSKILALVKTLEESRRDFKLDVVKKLVPMLRQVGWILHSVAALTFPHHPLPLLQTLMESRFSMEFSFKTAAQKLGELNLDHTATHADIESAFRRMSRTCHSDKGGKDEDFIRLTNIKDDLLKVEEGSLTRQLRRLFSNTIEEIPGEISRAIAEHLVNEDFGKLKPLVQAADSLQIIKDLVDPPLCCEQEAAAAHKLIRDYAKRLEAEALELWEKQHDNVNALRKLQSIFSSLKVINDSFSAWPDIYSVEALVLLRQKIDSRIDHLYQVARDSLPEDEEECWKKMEGFALNLVLIGALLSDLPERKEYAKGKINLLLNAATEKLWGFTYLFKLGMLLEQGKIGRLTKEGTVRPEDEMVAKAIVHEFKHFRDVLTVVWNTQTGATQRDVAATVRNVEGYTVAFANGNKAQHHKEEVSRELLLKGYEAYEQEFNANFEKWHIGEVTPRQLVAMVQEQCRALQPCRVGAWSDALRRQLPQLLGRIFAYFTISKSGDSFKRLEAAAEEGDAERVGNPASLDTVLQKAHNVQIITVLRLFGYDTPGTSKLRNHLMQIRTGEGKSMILGACSILFALLGFRVRCVCYSDYLSQRDYGLFQGLFQAFGVESLVTYSKITAYSEDAVARRGDIRQLTTQLLEGNLRLPAASTSLTQVEEEILLVDEVDVFFGPEFQGNTYNIIAQMQLEEVRAILTRIWENRADASNPRKLFQTVQASQEYKALQSKFNAWQPLLGAEVQAMCADLQHFEEPKCHYDARSDRIYYIVMDSPCYDVVYGYRTAFAYLKHSPKNVDASLHKALQLRISCGQFSYANVQPTCMLGVSGTLQALGDYEWGVMAKYGFSSYTLVPSVYGASNFRFLDQTGGRPITIEKSPDEFYQAITNDVKAKTLQKRAAIVFFQDTDALDKYLETSYAKQIPSKNLLLECQSHSEKETAIKRAASTSQATFTTAIFGRGTDFVCTDERLGKVGGVHVIQTFVAADLSEEKQIQGRTARQGKEGSYSLILLEKELRDLGMDTTRAAAMAPLDLHNLLKSKIQEKCFKASAEREKKLVTATERDRLSHEYLNALLAGNAAAAAPKLQEIYKQLRVGAGKVKLGKARIIILSDATGSMSGLWGSTRAQVQEMLRRVHELAGDSLELKWVAYRDYSDTMCLEQSPWTSQPLVLQQFVDKIGCHGGGDGEEAVEKALLLARQEHGASPITRILLMGDAPPHYESKGEKLNCHACHLETDYKVESQALKALGVPVFAFRIGNWDKTKEAFAHIANTTGGKYDELTPDKLIDAVCISALEEIGGSELVAEYMARYNA